MNRPADSFAVQISIPTDHPSLAGHFPGRPVVPGVVLLDCALQAIETRQRCALRSISAAKFLQPVLPDERIELRIQLSESGPTELRARIQGWRNEVVVIEGQFVLSSDTVRST